MLLFFFSLFRREPWCPAQEISRSRSPSDPQEPQLETSQGIITLFCNIPPSTFLYPACPVRFDLYCGLSLSVLPYRRASSCSVALPSGGFHYFLLKVIARVHC